MHVPEWTSTHQQNKIILRLKNDHTSIRALDKLILNTVVKKAN
jgi:hypothetical protein